MKANIQQTTSASIEQTPVEDVHWSSVHRRMLAIKGYYLKPDARVLDFGCGTGELVYQYRDAGFDACGFDIQPIAKLRKPEDERFFIHPAPQSDPARRDFHIDKSAFHIPSTDATFDFLCSISTLEHVLDLDLALSECSRVLKPGGLSIHVFPARYMRREPHIHVPFGGFFQNYSWYLFWALLGIRNQEQKGLGARETAKRNLNYARGFLNYPKLEFILGTARKHFAKVEVDPRLWELRVPNRSTFWASLLHMPWIHGAAHWWYCRYCTLVLFLVK